MSFLYPFLWTSFVIPWPGAALSVSNLKSLWAQSSSPHTYCRHVGTFAASSFLSLRSDVFNSGNEAGRLLTSILGQPALPSDSSHFGPSSQIDSLIPCLMLLPLCTDQLDIFLSVHGVTAMALSPFVSPIRIATKGWKLSPWPRIPHNTFMLSK